MSRHTMLPTSNRLSTLRCGVQLLAKLWSFRSWLLLRLLLHWYLRIRRTLQALAVDRALCVSKSTHKSRLSETATSAPARLSFKVPRDMPVDIADLTHEVRKTSTYYHANGNYADIWDCKWDTRRVAVKALRGISFDAEVRRAFREKMHNLCTIWVESGNRHPHILPFLGFCHNFGHLPALVYDFCDNGSIRQYLQFNPSADKLQLTLEAASGLAFLHSKKIIHADIRAANILINDKGQACIHDVGLALVIGQSDFTSASIAGPCRWMPPDVLLAGGDESDPLMGYSVWSDIWAFGMTILEVYTGEVPFSDTRHDAAVIRKIIQDVRPPRPSADLMGNEMWNICETCWNKTPEARPTMEALGKWLLELR